MPLDAEKPKPPPSSLSLERYAKGDFQMTIDPPQTIDAVREPHSTYHDGLIAGLDKAINEIGMEAIAPCDDSRDAVMRLLGVKTVLMVFKAAAIAVKNGMPNQWPQ